MGYVPLAHGSLSPDPCLYQTSQKPLWFPVFAPHPTHAACLLTLFLCWNRASLAKDSFLLAMMAPIQSLKKLRRFSNMLLTQWSRACCFGKWRAKRDWRLDPWNACVCQHYLLPVFCGICNQNGGRGVNFPQYFVQVSLLIFHHEPAWFTLYRENVHN